MKLVDALAKKLEARGLRLPTPLIHPLNGATVLFHDFVRCDLLKQASAMAYVTLLSLIPSLVAIFCVLSLFSPIVGKGSNLIDEIRAFILQNLASGSGDAAVAYLDRMLSSLDLASIGWSSFASVLVTLVMLLRQIEEALNRIWLIKKGRNVFTRFMYFWTFLTLGIVVLAVGVGVTSGFDVKKLVTSAADEVGGKGPIAALMSWAVPLVGSFLFFFFLYKVVPNCYVAAKSALWGAASAAVMLNVAARFYGKYVASSSNYQTLYGALAQLPLFLMWLYICWIIILLGALICWRVQEGFPKADDEETLDAVKHPLEQLRNVQVKSVMPLLTLLAIYKNFQQGTGRGLSGQDLAHKLKMPVSWVGDALDALGSLGYVIASKTLDDVTDGPTVTDPWYPAVPAEQLTMSRLTRDLAKPMEDWLAHWHHELPLDLRLALQVLTAPELGAKESATLADALTRIPSTAPISPMVSGA